MATVNKRTKPTLVTHEGAPAKTIGLEAQLRRSVMSCLLWEDEFYEDGVEIAERIADLCQKVDSEKVKEIAIEAKYSMGLRHVPLWMAVSGKIWDKNFLLDLIRRVDDITELLSLYWIDGKKPIQHQLHKALKEAFYKFDSYQIAKYRGNGKSLTLRDVMRLVRPKPKNDEQQKTFKELIDGTLKAPDMWETSLSSGSDKKETFERLMADGKLGALAFLRNLRNMKQASVPSEKIRQYFKESNFSKIIPFQLVQAGKIVPEFEPEIEEALFRAIAEMKKFTGHTVLLVDVSQSMSARLSSKSDITRSDVAGSLAMILREMCESIQVFAFGDRLYDIPARRGFAMAEQVKSRWEGTYLGQAINAVDANNKYDRIVVITDEQSHDRVPDPKGNGYMINVASAKNGVGYYKWTHIDGWSPSVLRFIQEFES